MNWMKYTHNYTCDPVNPEKSEPSKPAASPGSASGPREKQTGGKSPAKSNIHWADQMAGEIRARLENDAGLRAIVERQGLLIYDEKTPSGAIHIGSGRGWVIADAVRRSLTALGLPARFVLSADDYDPYDRPNSDLGGTDWSRYLGVPFSEIPSPVPGFASFGDYYFQQATAHFPALGIECSFESTARNYKSGVFNAVIRTVLDNAGRVQEIYRELYGEASEAAKKLPFNMLCRNCGKIATTVADRWDPGREQVSYVCRDGVVAWASGCGHEGADSPYDGGGKFPWKVEWAAKWPARGVIVEFGGKDHFSKGGARTMANRIAVDVLHYPPPYPSHGYATGPGYEFFQVGGAKMSTSKGTGMSFAEGVEFFPPELLRYLLLRSKPNAVVDFDPQQNDIILLAEHYDRSERIRFGTEPVEEGDRIVHSRLYELAAPAQPRERLGPQIPLTLASTMIQTCLTTERAIAKLQDMGHLPRELGPEDRRKAEDRLALAQRWLARYAGEQFIFRVGDETQGCPGLSPDQGRLVGLFAKYLAQREQLKAIEKAKAMIGDAISDAVHDQDPGSDTQQNSSPTDALQSEIYTFARAQGIEPRDFFKILYLALIGKDRGPQLGGFLLSVGLEKAARILQASARSAGEKHD